MATVITFLEYLPIILTIILGFLVFCSVLCLNRLIEERKAGKYINYLKRFKYLHFKEDGKGGVSVYRIVKEGNRYFIETQDLNSYLEYVRRLRWWRHWTVYEYKEEVKENPFDFEGGFATKEQAEKYMRILYHEKQMEACKNIFLGPEEKEIVSV